MEGVAASVAYASPREIVARHPQQQGYTVSLITPQYLPWRYMIPRDFVLSTVLAFSERVAERIFLPGLHRAANRVVDPTRIDDLSTLVSHSIALMLLIWMFYLGLYTISIFTKRPIKPYATAIVGGGLMIVVFIGSTAEWFALPTLPK
jgi:hypothetical protein